MADYYFKLCIVSYKEMEVVLLGISFPEDAII